MLVNVYRNLSFKEDALEKFQEALRIWRKVYGNNHQHIAGSLSNIGIVYIDLNMQEDALEKFQEALKIFKQVYGNNHPDVANCLKNICEAYFLDKEMQKSLESAIESLIISTECRDSDVVGIKKNIKFVCERYYRIIEDYMNNSSFLSTKLNTNTNDIKTLNMMNETSNMYMKLQGKYSDLSIYLETVPEVYNVITKSIEAVGKTYMHYGSYERAFEKFHSVKTFNGEIASLDKNILLELRQNAADKVESLGTPFWWIIERYDSEDSLIITGSDTVTDSAIV